MSALRTIGALAGMLVGGLFIITAVPSLNYNNAVIGIIITGVSFVLLGRGLARGREQHKSYVAIDFIATILIAVFFLVMFIGALAGLIASDQQTQNVTQFLLAMGMGGIVLAFVTRVLVFAPTTTKVQFNKNLLYILGNFAAFFLLNLIVPPASYKILGLSITASSPFITVLISVPETIVFNVWLAPWFANISKTGAIGGAFFGAIVAAAYHLFVLGTSPASLGIVFGAFFVIDFTAIQSRSASVPMVSHLINNFLSVIGL